MNNSEVGIELSYPTQSNELTADEFKRMKIKQMSPSKHTSEFMESIFIQKSIGPEQMPMHIPKMKYDKTNNFIKTIKP